MRWCAAASVVCAAQRSPPCRPLPVDAVLGIGLALLVGIQLGALPDGP